MKLGMKQISKIGAFLAALLVALTVTAAPGSIIPIYKTNPPQPALGFDVSSHQTVAIRFSPIEDVTLNTIEVWFMNNSTTEQGQVRITLHHDKKTKNELSVPGKEVIESWSFPVSSLGWNTAKEVLVSKINPKLMYNQRYWLVAESDASPLNNPVWSIADSQNDNISLGFAGSYNRDEHKWASLGYSAIPTVTISGELPENP
ncbi:MAG: hypothetical protein WC627_06060 [Legionella sp.]|jgi:hypothetical protein